MKETLLNLWEENSQYILHLGGNLLIALLIITTGIILSKGMRRIIKKTKLAGLDEGGTITALFRGIIRYGIIIICAIMALNVFGINTASLLAILGAAGLAVGLALRETLGNIAAGIILIFQVTYKKGEFIEFGAFMGTVTEINLFKTVLETPDGIHISAPNAFILDSPVRNYTRNEKRRMELSVCIAYSDSVDAAFKVMQEIIENEPRFLKEPVPKVILQEINDSSVRITIRAWTGVQNYWDIFWDKNKILKEKIEAAGLHVPFPQRDIHIIQK